MGKKKIKKIKYIIIEESSSDKSAKKSRNRHKHSKKKSHSHKKSHKTDVTDDSADFDIKTFLKRHLRVRSWINERTQSYTKRELKEVASMALEQFKKEPMLATMPPPCIVVGDIHGQYRDLIRILNAYNDDKEKGLELTKNNYVFLGDYVDRGTHSVECICLVFSLKIIFPQCYILLRGNHETKAINYAYGFREELISKIGRRDGIEVWERFNEAFAWMPLACLIGHKILCMHGGISPYLKTLDDIKNIKRPLPNAADVNLALDLLWSDPIDEKPGETPDPNVEYMPNRLRGLSCTFNGAATLDVCNRLNLLLIVRAHQVMDGGFKFSNNRKLVTVFSAPRYMRETNNSGAVMHISATGAISFTVYSVNATTSKPIGSEPVPRDEDLEDVTKAELESIKEAIKSGSLPVMEDKSMPDDPPMK